MSDEKLRQFHELLGNEQERSNLVFQCVSLEYLIIPPGPSLKHVFSYVTGGDGKAISIAMRLFEHSIEHHKSDLPFWTTMLLLSFQYEKYVQQARDDGEPAEDILVRSAWFIDFWDTASRRASDPADAIEAETRKFHALYVKRMMDTLSKKELDLIGHGEDARTLRKIWTIVRLSRCFSTKQTVKQLILSLSDREINGTELKKIFEESANPAAFIKTLRSYCYDSADNDQKNIIWLYASRIALRYASRRKWLRKRPNAEKDIEFCAEWSYWGARFAHHSIDEKGMPIGLYGTPKESYTRAFAMVSACSETAPTEKIIDDMILMFDKEEKLPHNLRGLIHDARTQLAACAAIRKEEYEKLAGLSSNSRFTHRMFGVLDNLPAITNEELTVMINGMREKPAQDRRYCMYRARAIALFLVDPDVLQQEMDRIDKPRYAEVMRTRFADIEKRLEEFRLDDMAVAAADVQPTAPVAPTETSSSDA